MVGGGRQQAAQSFPNGCWKVKEWELVQHKDLKDYNTLVVNLLDVNSNGCNAAAASAEKNTYMHTEPRIEGGVMELSSSSKFALFTAERLGY